MKLEITKVLTLFLIHTFYDHGCLNNETDTDKKTKIQTTSKPGVHITHPTSIQTNNWRDKE